MLHSNEAICRRAIGQKGIKGLKIKFFESVNKCIGPIQTMSKFDNGCG